MLLKVGGQGGEGGNPLNPFWVPSNANSTLCVGISDIQWVLSIHLNDVIEQFVPAQKSRINPEFPEVYSTLLLWPFWVYKAITKTIQGHVFKSTFIEVQLTE